jgi:hypothetical protein
MIRALYRSAEASLRQTAPLSKSLRSLTMATALIMIEVRGGAVW